jgi:hypothetical protein
MYKINISVVRRKYFEFLKIPGWRSAFSFENQTIFQFCRTLENRIFAALSGKPGGRFLFSSAFPFSSVG